MSEMILSGNPEAEADECADPLLRLFLTQGKTVLFFDRVGDLVRLSRVSGEDWE